MLHVPPMYQLILSTQKITNRFTNFAGLSAKIRFQDSLNPLTPNDPYRGHTAPLSSKSCILYIYSTNIGTEYFKHGIYCPFFSLKNAVCSIILTYLVRVLFTFYVQGMLQLKNNSGAKRLMPINQSILKVLEKTPCRIKPLQSGSKLKNAEYKPPHPKPV
jgi:hypothetical protein